MKSKFLIGSLIAALTLPVAVSAQTSELRRDRQDIREERRDVRDAQRYGTRADVRDERRDVREARQEYREDWRDYRNRNRSLYRGGAFNAPFRYRSFNEGARFDRGYAGSRYRVADVARWRLPPAGRNAYYVRHYNDLLLIDARNNTVRRVYRGFYW